MFQEKDPTLVEDFRLMLRAGGLHDAESLLSGYRSGAWEPTFLRLLVEMDPHITPTLAGQDMTPTGIGALAQDIINSDAPATPEQQRSLAWVTDHRLWHWWRTLTGMDRALMASARYADLPDPTTLLHSTGLHEHVLRRHHLAVNHSGQVYWTTQPPPRTVGRVLLDPAVIALYWQQSIPILIAWHILLATAPLETNVALAAYIHDNTPQLPHQTWWTTLTNGEPTQLPLAATLTRLAHTAENQYTQALSAITRDRKAEQLRNAANDVAGCEQAAVLLR